MSARDAILTRIRGSLGVEAGDTERAREVDGRLETTPRHTVPNRIGGGAAAQRALFVRMLEQASATVASVAIDEVPEAIANYLKSQNLPQQVRTGSDSWLAGLDWSRVPHLERQQGPAVDEDQVGLAAAFAGISETGTLMLNSGPDNPTTNNFLPETHIIAVPASRLCGSYEDAWDALREQTGRGEMPRTVNFISGPSRTADIEQTIVLGAHGPRKLHVIIVDGC